MLVVVYYAGEKRMPKPPLSHDARNACFCHKACSDFHKPQSRYWITVSTSGQVPELDSGVFLEIGVQPSSGQNCVWPQFPPAPITKVVQLEKVSEAVFPATGYRWLFKYQDILAQFDYLAELIGTDTRCDGNKVLPVVAGPAGWSEATLTQILWWQNADDVPH